MLPKSGTPAAPVMQKTENRVKPNERLRPFEDRLGYRGRHCRLKEEHTDMQQEYTVQMLGITKRFSGVLALNDVSLQVKKGEVHALVGENGAGKSTLMKILSGAYTKDSGEIVIDGQPMKNASSKTAIEMGVAVIYQEFMLAPDLTVAENIYIDNLAGGKGLIHWKELRAKAKEQLNRLGFGEIDPGAKVGELSVAYQQVVEICKCLTRNSKVLVLDEPTAVLTFSEIEKLFGIIENLKKQGVSIIYISHRMEEIFRLCDTITVLKDGKYVKTLPTAETDKDSLVALMVGREMSQMFPDRVVDIGPPVLQVEHLCAGKMVQDVSFTVHAGEILGFSGLVGAGRTETMRALFGADKKDSGTVTFLGKEAHFKDPKEAIQNGLGLLPEDRKSQGLLLHQSIRINTTLASMKKAEGPLGLLQHRKEKEYVQQLLKDLATKYASTENNISSLSGGNQQKVALAKWLSAECRCLIFDEPTRGVDVGAKAEIYGLMNRLAAQGVAIIMISSEMTEIIGMCDRAIVMRQGKVAGEVPKADLTENQLIRYAMGVV